MLKIRIFVLIKVENKVIYGFRKLILYFKAYIFHSKFIFYRNILSVFILKFENLKLYEMGKSVIVKLCLNKKLSYIVA